MLKRKQIQTEPPYLSYICLPLQCNSQPFPFTLPSDWNTTFTELDTPSVIREDESLPQWWANNRDVSKS